MKKKISLLLAVTMLLSGCSEDKNVIERIEQTTETTTVATASPEIKITTVSDTSATTTVKIEPQYDFIIPEISEEQIHFYINEKKVVHFSDLKKELNIGEEETVRFYPYYIGEENADWLIQVCYFDGMNDYFTYVDLVTVKDGVIIKNTGKLDAYSYRYISYDNSDFFMTTSFDGIIRYNFATGETENIGAEFVMERIIDQTRIIDLDESYMLFYLLEKLYAFDRNTGKCLDTGLEFNAMTNSAAKLEGGKILIQDNMGENKRIYDIETGEIIYDYSIEIKKDKFRFSMGDFEFHSYCDETSDRQLLWVKRISDGAEKTFDVDIYYKDCIEKQGIRIKENYIILCPLSKSQIAINFDNEQVYEIILTKGYEDWWYASCADGVSSALQLQNGAAAEVEVILPGIPYDNYGNLYS